jgi:hypothetical protein
MAIETFLLPLQNIPQTFDISLGGVAYTFTCKYNSAPEGGWALDIADANTGDVIVAYLPLITGVNLFAGLGYLGFQGSLVVFTDGDDFAVPTLENLGVESNVYLVTEVA